MIKKILFFGIAIILGLMVWMTSYYSFYMGYTQDMIYTAIAEDDYDTLAKIFLPFYNKEGEDLGGNDEFDIFVYEGVVANTTKITVDGNEQTVNRYQDAFIFFVDNIGFDLEGKKESDTSPVKNYSSLVFYNEEASLDYTFTFNDPIDGVEGAEGTNRYYVSAAKSLNFCEIDLNTNIIEEELAGKITKVEVIDGKGESVGTVDCNLDLTSSYFTEVKELVAAYDQYLDDLDATKYTEFYNTWLAEYNNVETNGVTLSDAERKPTSIYVKTIIVMVIYIAICGVLGYFILRKKEVAMKPYMLNKNNAPKAEVKEVKNSVPTEEKNISPKNETEEVTVVEPAKENEDVTEVASGEDKKDTEEK